jgi:hypothetical protein
MIESWDEFFRAVKRMREHQKVYFATKDPIALNNAKKFEITVDECIEWRQAKIDAAPSIAKFSKAIQEDKHGKN